MSAFDPASFMNAAVTGQMDTSLPMVPAGEYNAFIDKVDYKSFPISKGDRAGEVFHKLECMCKIISPGTDADGRTVRKDCVLDITPAGQLDVSKGKNIDLGQMREATGLNDPAQPFAPAMLTGRMVRVLVSHEADKNDPNKFYSRVQRVSKAQ